MGESKNINEVWWGENSYRIYIWGPTAYTCAFYTCCRCKLRACCAQSHRWLWLRPEWRNSSTQVAPCCVVVRQGCWSCAHLHTIWLNIKLPYLRNLATVNLADFHAWELRLGDSPSKIYVDSIQLRNLTGLFCLRLAGLHSSGFSIWMYIFC